jgi:hypothetical protein
MFGLGGNPTIYNTDFDYILTATPFDSWGLGLVKGSEYIICTIILNPKMFKKRST